MKYSKRDSMNNRIKPNIENESDYKQLSQLKESEKLFRSTFEQAAVGIAHVGTNGNFIQINQKFCDIFRYSQQEMLKLTFQDITHPDDLSADLEYYEQMLAREIKTYSMEKRYICKDSTIVWVNFTISLARESYDDPKFFRYFFKRDSY